MEIYSHTFRETKPKVDLNKKTLSETFLSKETFIQQKESINKDIKRVINDVTELKNNFKSIQTSLEELKNLNKTLKESKDLNKDSKLVKLNKLNKLLLLSRFI
jgi:queuine/archaeosine tRNA-ribosyltransferase